MQVIKDIKACVFDAYGTLFDVHSSVRRYQHQLGDIANNLSNIWRQKQLEYTWLRSLMHRYTDFWQVTSHALDYAFDTFDVDDERLKSDLLNTYLQLDCYPEVPETLTRLRQHGKRLAILSNGSPHMLASAVRASGIHDLLDELMSVESVGIYKPDPLVYRFAVDRLGIPAHSVAFQSSNAWDIAGAASFGFRTVWINRSDQPCERLSFEPDVELKSLHKLPDLFSAEL